MSTYDAPNQQVVGGAPPWEEGTGGEAGPSEPTEPTAPPDGDPTPAEPAPDGDPSDLDALTKAELLDYARQLGVSPANNDMTKEELRAGVDAKLAEQG